MTLTPQTKLSRALSLHPDALSYLISLRSPRPETAQQSIDTPAHAAAFPAAQPELPANPDEAPAWVTPDNL